ncbi:MAG TPA: HAD hydrolase-like protein [Polyangiaceae bacterium]|jgi:phosphoglycolate phosphatase
MHLFFDLDGTLTDSRPGIMSGMRHALRAIGREEPSDEALLPFIGPPTHDAFRALLGSADAELNERTIRIYRQHYAEHGWAQNSVYPGISASLKALSEAGFGLWVVTSKPHVFATRIVEHFELGPFFQRVYGSELDGVRSHKGELIAHVLESEAVRASDAWMIGDRLHDIRGAKQNGLRSAGVLWGYGSRDELANEGADAIFSDMPELVRAFTR